MPDEKTMPSPEGKSLVTRMIGGAVHKTLRTAITAIKPNDWMSALQPLIPWLPMVMGRQWDFPVGKNINYIPRGQEKLTFFNLRAFARNSEIVRLAIETRKDQLCSQPWQIKGKDGSDVDEDDPRIIKWTKFFKKPDGENKWNDWYRILLEELFVTDAVTIWRMPNKINGLAGLRLLDGATIFPLITDQGYKPQPPDPAYQQILKGVPKGNHTTDELIYAVRNRRVYTTYGYCYDPETEILSRKGWVKFTDLDLATEVATRSPDGKFEWQKPTRIIEENWNGDMYSFKSRSLDLFVTPEHRMLTDRKTNPILSAQELANKYCTMTKIPMLSTWDGKEVEDIALGTSELQEVEVSRVRNGKMQNFSRNMKSATVRTFSGDDYCALMGAYIAEGNLRSQGGIEIAQRAFSKGYADYRRLIVDKLGGSYNGKSFILSWCAITEHFSQFGHAHEKFVPEDIVNATPRQIEIFLKYYMLGDGHFEKSINQSGRGEHPKLRPRATTVSKKLADQLVELAQKIGASASVRTRPARRQKILNYESDCREAYIVSFRYSKAMGFKASKEAYKGKIYCVTVPNGIVYVRRNGKPAWCGNSPVEQCIQSCIQDIKRSESQTAYFTVGSVPDAYMTMPDGMPQDAIKAFGEYLNDMLAGNIGGKRQVPVAPFGTKIEKLKEQILKDDFDEWVARKICFALSIPPTPFIKQMNRATAQSSQEQAIEEGQGPVMNWTIELMNSIMEFQGDDDLEFAFLDDKELDQAVQSTILVAQVGAGLITRNEARDTLGLDPVDEPAADALMVTTASGLMPLPGSEMDQQMQEQKLDQQIQINASKPAPVAPGQPAPRGASNNKPKPKNGDKKPVGKAVGSHKPLNFHYSSDHGHA
jgi:hypothetical protein